MNEKVTRFYEAVSTDKGLQEELVEVTSDIDLDDVETARTAMAEAVAAFAAEHDLDLTAEDLLTAEAESETELSDEELAAISGGSCGCVLFGAAKGCACVIIGSKQMGALIESYKSEKVCAILGF